MLQTLLTMQVSLCHFILTLLTIQVTYAGNTLLNTVTGKKKTENKKLQKKSKYGIEVCKIVITHSNFPLYIDFFS